MMMKYLVFLVLLLLLSVSFLACGNNLEPIEVISVKAVGMPNPGGPTIEITLKNVSSELVISVKCILQLDGEKTFDYDFPEVSTATPLQPDATTSQTLILIGPTGYSDEAFYPLMITVKLVNGQTFSYVKQIQVE
jgi:hypothetical protein